MRYMYCFFFFNDTATTEIYTLSLHDALPICGSAPEYGSKDVDPRRVPLTKRIPMKKSRLATALAVAGALVAALVVTALPRSEEHTSELQSRQYLVCRLLLEKKKHIIHIIQTL